MVNQQHIRVQPITAIELAATDFYYKRINGWIDEEGVGQVRFWYKLQEKGPDLVRTEEGYRTLPAASVEPLIERYDIVTGDVVIKETHKAAFLQQFNLQPHPQDDTIP